MFGKSEEILTELKRLSRLKWRKIMNKEQLKRGNELQKSIDTLDDLSRLMYTPYPQFSGTEKAVNSAGFDKDTLDELKEVILDFCSYRKAELQEEFDSL